MNTIKKYVFLFSLLLVVLIVNILINVKGNKDGIESKKTLIQLQRSIVKPNKVYTYSDAIAVIRENEKVNIIKSNLNPEENNKIIIEVKVPGGIKQVFDFVEALKEKENFIQVKSIKIDNNKGTAQSILSVEFIRTL